jgi:dTDP-glucose pyrophosphorylase/predicted transcriptional regulator
MKTWEKVLLSPDATIRDAIKAIDASSLQIALVVDSARRLKGTITDGDVRRGILKGISLDRPVTEVMNPHPTVANMDDTRDSILATMKLRAVRQIPVLDKNDSVAGIELLNDLIQPRERDNRVVLMAGGIGSRLRPLTNDCPKPLIQVGNKPILETILENFIEYGFRHFYISVNYMADMVKDHFKDGSHWGVDIRYIHEDKAMGTAGPIGLLPETLNQPLLVMNGDLLTKVNFQQLLDFHLEHQSQATMCVREYDFQVPYGVVRLEKHRLLQIEEKPVQRFFVNAGIYVLEPKVLKHIPHGDYFDMTDLFAKIITQGLETAAFPIREYWIDIGRLDDLERAKGEYQGIFE